MLLLVVVVVAVVVMVAVALVLVVVVVVVVVVGAVFYTPPTSFQLPNLPCKNKGYLSTTIPAVCATA